LAIPAFGKLYTSDVGAQKSMWAKFKQDFKRNYENSTEDSVRFGNFVRNLKRIDSIQQMDIDAGTDGKYSINKYTDWSETEFKRLLGFKKQYKNHQNATHELTNTATCTTTPSLVDWSGTLVTEIYNQGLCGCCWAFSSAEQVESDSIRLNLATKSFTLSQEQLVQCSTANQGCGGGDYAPAFAYLAHPTGLESLSNYPYTSGGGNTGSPCLSSASKELVYVSASSNSTSGSETCMANHVQNTGTLAIAVYAENWLFYSGGVMSASTCGGSVSDVDHAVQAVGVYPSTSGGYWKIRNSWGADWGESGYIRVQYGVAACGLTQEAWFTTPALL